MIELKRQCQETFEVGFSPKQWDTMGTLNAFTDAHISVSVDDGNTKCMYTHISVPW